MPWSALSLYTKSYTTSDAWEPSFKNLEWHLHEQTLPTKNWLTANGVLVGKPITPNAQATRSHSGIG